MNDKFFGKFGFGISFCIVLMLGALFFLFTTFKLFLITLAITPVFTYLFWDWVERRSNNYIKSAIDENPMLSEICGYLTLYILPSSVGASIYFSGPLLDGTGFNDRGSLIYGSSYHGALFGFAILVLFASIVAFFMVCIKPDKPLQRKRITNIKTIDNTRRNYIAMLVFMNEYKNRPNNSEQKIVQKIIFQQIIRIGYSSLNADIFNPDETYSLLELLEWLKNETSNTYGTDDKMLTTRNHEITDLINKIKA